ncbi:MAG: 8-oxoguanine deaminase [Desulfobacteraceae bacterium]|nr:8-oxoguanine deaminase [Desulfobacteraceae bacterium]
MTAPEKETILLKNCFHIWTGSDAPYLENCDIMIQDGRISSIGSNLLKNDQNSTSSLQVIDCSNHVVLPGFINTHHHFYQTLTRNIPAVQNAKLFDWLVYLYDIWKYIGEEAVFYSSLLAMGELLKTGCTLTTDHHYLYPNDINCDIMATQFKAADTLGIRFSPTRGSMSLSKKDGGLPPDSVVQTQDDILNDSERVIQQFHDDSDLSMKKIILAPCSPFSVTKELMKETVAMARKYKVQLHTHLAETADENEYCLKIYNKRPLELMLDCDFIGEDVSYAHGIFFNDEELKILQKTRTHIAHCPTSNMRLGSGICRVQDMRKLGINVGLGVDGSASNDSSDMLGEIRNALLLQRVKYGADSMTANDVLKMATQNGANLLNFESLGQIKQGFAADLAIFNIKKMEYAGALSDPVAALIFSGFNHATDYTIVNGKIVVENGKLKGFDEDDIMNKANALSQKMIRRHVNHGSR